ncbi:MAG: DUF1573 domain-containing protein [Bacteroidaceae bacterium]|nr:DUF1573 domain-containing protein [Bacteroidaceae bacterium]
MNRIVLLALALTLSFQAQAQTKKQKVNISEVQAVATTKAKNYAELTFDTLRYNFGKFSKSAPLVRCSFPFTNTGTAPLIIHQAFASCGCTIPSYTKEPIKAGEKGVIDVTYDGTDKFPGHFQKTITIRSNAINEVVRLVIEGTME